MLRALLSGVTLVATQMRIAPTRWWALALVLTLVGSLAATFLWTKFHACESQKPTMAELKSMKNRLQKREQSSLVPVATGLAHAQSFGFFTDIPDSAWKIAQRLAAKTFPNEHQIQKYANGPNDKGKSSKLRYSNRWNGHNFQEEFHCAFAQRIPSSSLADGPKWVCDPHRIAAQKSCLVYSVGSNGNTHFEKAILNDVSADCEIHTFDVKSRNNMQNEDGSKGIDFKTALKGISTFHHWGIGTEAQAARHSKTRKGDPIKTVEQTMKELGHTGRTVDIFKIDCEWCEWFTFESWLKADMRQILVETHNAPMPNAQRFFHALHDHGYVIFSKEANYINGAGGVEFAFLKPETSFFIEGTLYSDQTPK